MDVFGHGVHLSGTAVAQDNNKGSVGVAPGAKTHSLKVLDDNGEAGLSEVIAALDSVITYKSMHPGSNIVVNMSFGADIGTSAYNALDEAVEMAIEKGIIVVVAAGNDGDDVSTFTPAHVAGAITVGAYDVYDRFAYFSNYGPGVDILAPGVDILSTGLAEGKLAPALMSGTSMDGVDAEQDMKRMFGIIDSMTAKERRDPKKIIDTSRRRRIAAGAGVEPKEVSDLVKQFDAMASVMKEMAGMGMRERMRKVQELQQGGAFSPDGGLKKVKSGTGKRLTAKEKAKRKKEKEREQRRKRRQQRGIKT